MKKVILLLAVFSLAGTLWAADAFVGAWKFDIAKSKLKPDTAGKVVKESILVIGEKGTARESYGKDAYTDGSSTTTKWTVPQQGGIVKIQQGEVAKGEMYIVTRISGGEDYWTKLQDGKQVEEGHWTVSSDGKTIRGTGTGTDARGKPYEFSMVGTRQ
jgi:hypothetical protein